MQHLIVSLMGPNPSEITHELCKLISHSGCHIIDCRITTFGTDFIGNLLLGGNWNALAKFETGLPILEQKYELRSLLHRSKLPKPDHNQLPYQVFVTTLAETPVPAKITQFFAKQGLPLYDLHIASFKAPHTEAQMLYITMTILIDKNKLIADIREEFMLFCDENNFDAIMEPYKN